MLQTHFSLSFPYKLMKYSNSSLSWFQELFLRAFLSDSLCVLCVCIFLAVTTFLKIPKGATNCVIRKLTPTSGKTGINHKHKGRWSRGFSGQYFPKYPGHLHVCSCIQSVTKNILTRKWSRLLMFFVFLRKDFFKSDLSEIAFSQVCSYIISKLYPELLRTEKGSFHRLIQNPVKHLRWSVLRK